MRAIAVCTWAMWLAAGVAGGQSDSLPGGENLLTRYLDWADIHPPARVDGLTVFPICLSRTTDRLDGVMSMADALDRGVLVVEELASAQVSRARFINKSRDRMIFLMAGEVLTGGKQNRTLQSDALLGPSSSTVLPLYCVQKGRWRGGGKFSSGSLVAPQAVRERAAAKAGQDAVWSEVARANRRLKSATASDDLAAAMGKPENARRLASLRGRITPHLPRGCVGVVVAVRGRIVGADLFNSPELLAALRDKVLNSYLSQYAWPLPVRRRARVGIREVTAEQVRAYLRDCYRSRFVAGESRGVGRIYTLRGPRTGQTLGYGERTMVHTALTSAGVLPVRPVPRPGPMPRR